MSPYLDLPYLDVSILLVNLLSIFAGIRSQMSKGSMHNIGDLPNSDHEPEDIPHDFLEPGINVTAEELEGGDDGGEGEDEKPRNVRPKVVHPSSPRGANAQILPSSAATATDRDVPGPAKLRVVVKDVAYATYRTVLDYLYMDRIRFAPLSSSFLSSCSPGATCEQSANDSQASLGPVTRMGSAEVNAGASSRREWIQKWEHGNPGHPVPYSAKAVYRLADKLGLAELKSRAFEHITKSFTVENVPYEVFSTFSATFELVRKVEVKSFLDHWAEMRSSDAMRRVWHQIRLGRHPGFEEGSHVPPLCRSTPVDPYPPVWPVIATQLEFKPHNSWADFDELENDENLTPAQ
ncbi:hypothetical protein EDB85DRAFT_2277658 [Lactarius pseudohatsudake]|nr:hypothetical protein EDB85DRAFT_2277658 [Lactarius pseudohatsudake]